jgi:hypothetical protein
MGMDRRYLVAEQVAAEQEEARAAERAELAAERAELGRVLVRLSRAFGAMPYGAAAQFAPIRFDRVGAPVDTPVEALDLVADNLERFVATLRGVSTRAEANEAELRELRIYLQHAAELGRRMIDLAGEAPK